MILNREKGGWLLGPVMRMTGSFRTAGAGSPTVYRDGNSKAIQSVTRVSAGLFTIQLQNADLNFPIPPMLVAHDVAIAQAAAPTNLVNCYYVKDSWNQTTRSFQIACRTSANAAADPDTGDLISFELVGCIDSSGVDPA